MQLHLSLYAVGADIPIPVDVTLKRNTIIASFRAEDYHRILFGEYDLDALVRCDGDRQIEPGGRFVDAADRSPSSALGPRRYSPIDISVPARRALSSSRTKAIDAAVISDRLIAKAQSMRSARNSCAKTTARMPSKT
jgi:hypothetical protein